MYRNFVVKIPETKGIVIRKDSSRYVLYKTAETYFPDKRYATSSRVVIGKQSKDDPAMMYPNDNFEDIFPEVVLPAALPPAYRSGAIRFGTYVIIKKILLEYGLPAMLQKRLGDRTGLFLDLVSYLIIEKDNAAQHYHGYAFGHALFSEEMKIFSDSTVSRLLGSITEDMVLKFLDDWNAKRDHRQRLYVSYDSTNKNCQAGDIDLVEFGHAKDNLSIPIFNVAIAFDTTNRIPLLYELYKGSIPDVSEFSYFVDKVKSYGYRRIGFVLDRGYFSVDNIQYMDENHYDFVIMVKGCKKLVSSLILDVRGSFELDSHNFVRHYCVYGTTIPHKLYASDKKNRYFHIFYDPDRMSKEVKKIEKEVEEQREILEQHEGKAVVMPDRFGQYFTLNYDDQGLLLYADEKMDAVKRRKELCGYFCIITSEKMTAEEALVLYKGRDASEKLFSGDKTFIGSRCSRTHSRDNMAAKIFLEFVALIVRNRIYNLLKEQTKRMKSRPVYMSAVPSAIIELEGLEITSRNNHKYKLDTALTKCQKDIYAAFGISEEDVRREAVQLSKILESSKLFGEEEENDDESEEDDCFD